MGLKPISEGCMTDVEFERLFFAIDEKLKENGTVTVAVDGDCGSGKTTLARKICERFHGRIVSVDDFFLPFEMRTPERLNEPGGNFDRDRFLRQIAPHIRCPGAFEYDRFDCSTGELEPVNLPSALVTVVDGSYSLHPALRDLYDIRVFLAVDENTQKTRILERNGEKMLASFVSRWIPMEKNYQRVMKPEQCCDFVFRT